MSSRSRNPLATLSQNHVQYQLFASQSGGKSCMGLLLHEHEVLLPCQPRIRTPHFEQPTGTNKAFLGLVAIQVPVLSSFFSVNMTLDILIFSSNERCHSKFFHYIVYCFYIAMLMWIFFFTNYATVFLSHDTYSAGVVLQMSTFLICTVHLLFMTYNKL
jgi:hypothetical protein